MPRRIPMKFFLFFFFSRMTEYLLKETIMPRPRILSRRKSIGNYINLWLQRFFDLNGTVVSFQVAIPQNFQR